MAKTKYYNKDTQKWEYAETGCIPVRGTHYWIAQDLKPLHDYISNRVMATAEVCFLTVSVTSNQPDKSVLEGLVLNVTLPDGRTAEMEAGSVIAFTEGSVTVQFPEVAGYRKPDNVSVSYAKGSVTQQATYLAEEVTVNALVDGAASSDYSYEVSGEGIVCLTGSGTSFTGVTKWLVPHGVTITVTPSTVDGYTTSSVTHTASGVTGSVSVEWSEIRLGVFIEDTTGKLWTADSWDGSATANGIAVLAENCRFVMALFIYGMSGWSSMTKFVNGIVSTKSFSVAESDYNGKENTAAIMLSSAESEANYIPNLCAGHTFPNGQQGYLGAAGEWKAVYDNFTTISAIYKKFSLYINNRYWTSTEYDADEAWTSQPSASGTSYSTKSTSNYGIPFTTLKMDTV